MFNYKLENKSKFNSNYTNEIFQEKTRNQKVTL